MQHEVPHILEIQLQAGFQKRISRTQALDLTLQLRVLKLQFQ